VPLRTRRENTGTVACLLALKVALAPCVIGYAEIATRLAARPSASILRRLAAPGPGPEFSGRAFFAPTFLSANLTKLLEGSLHGWAENPVHIALIESSIAELNL